MSAKPKLTYRQEQILRAARDAKSIEVDGKSLRPVETLRDHGLVRFTRRLLLVGQAESEGQVLAAPALTVPKPSADPVFLAVDHAFAFAVRMCLLCAPIVLEHGAASIVSHRCFFFLFG
jgi:hypothetical protein